MIKTSIIIGLIVGIKGRKIRVNPNLPDQPDANLYIWFRLKQVTGWSGKFYKLLWLYSVWFDFLFWAGRNPNYPDQPVNLLKGFFFLIQVQHLQKKKLKESCPTHITWPKDKKNYYHLERIQLKLVLNISCIKRPLLLSISHLQLFFFFVQNSKEAFSNIKWHLLLTICDSLFSLLFRKMQKLPSSSFFFLDLGVQGRP